MTTLTLAGNTMGGLDGYAAVQDAVKKLAANSNDPYLIATYNAAFGKRSSNSGSRSRSREVIPKSNPNQFDSNVTWHIDPAASG